MEMKLQMIDVKEIRDIPKITEYLDIVCDLECYSIGDKTQMYSVDVGIIPWSVSVNIISDCDLIEPKKPLINIITDDEVQYFEWTQHIDGKILVRYCYRPLVSDKLKKLLLI